MKSALVLTGFALFSVTVFAKEPAKIAAKWTNKIVCTEILGSASDGADDGDDQSKPIGTYTIELNADSSIKSIQIERGQVKDFAPINMVITGEYATFKHDVRDNDKDLAETWGIQKVEAIEATFKNGDNFLIRVNDHTYAGPVGSNALFTMNGKNINTGDTSMVDCLGAIKFPREGQLRAMRE